MARNTLLIAVAAPLLCLASFEWLRRVQTAVPEPYLDEFFHVPQADTYWQGRWTDWDDKITTPPGVYLWSIFLSKFVWVDSRQSNHLSPYQLRFTNAVLPYLMIACVTAWERSLGTSSRNSWTARRQLCIFAFPLVFFFSGLYYTDVFSALTVLCTYSFWQAGLARKSGFQKLGFQTLHLLCGLLSLASRQTNIFWVAVFMGGLQVVHTIKQKARVHDPPLQEAYLEDVFTMIFSLVSSVLHAIPELVLDLWPHLALLASFGAFVVWNGGVVLGDKSNHVATIHVAQMLYIWPFIIFFSWPVLLPYLAQPEWLLKQLPRYWLVPLAIFLTAAIVHYNTIIHEFLLADNRHYTFYVFKILRTRPWLWYALVPVYVVAAWLSIAALGGGPGRTVKQQTGKKKQQGERKRQQADETQEHGNHLSFVLVWVLSTALSLVTAPLVEPRYFMVPWLIWRLHVLDSSDVLVSRARVTREMTNSDTLRFMVSVIGRESIWIELLWYMTINFMTCRLFLEHEFRWVHSPLEVQRFMW